MMRFILFSIVAASLAGQRAAACQLVSGDQITGRDMAAVMPQLAVVAPDVKIGFAPAPGAQRVFRAVELQQLAKRFGINSELTQPACFAWEMQALSKETIAAAIAKSLTGKVVQVEITDQSHALVPVGEVSFPLQGYTGESDKPAVWNGLVVYGGTRKYNTWAQVRITVHEKRILATRAIAAGEVIDGPAVKTVTYDGPLGHVLALQEESEVIGNSARWSIAAGNVLVKSMLMAPQDVEKEQLVTVRVDSGAAHIETQGIAADSGYRGTVIRVRNPKTGRVFRARIDDRGSVTVVPGGMVGLVVEDKKS